MRTDFWIIILSCWAAGVNVSQGADAAFLWSTQVRPLLDTHCVKCHGPIEQKSELELDTPEAVMRGGYEGEVVVPGDPDRSRLYLYLAQDSDPHMPPKKQLTDEDRALIRSWILALGQDVEESNEQGTGQAEQDFSGPTEAIDALVAKGWQLRGATPVSPADDRTWCRRIYLDLAGRIPTPSELEAFVFSPDPDKRTALVDEMLASKEYAVRMRELWDVFLMGRPERERHKERREQNGWWSFLEYSFHSGRPWNETVRDFLSARPETPETEGATWFVYERRDRHQEIAEAVAPVVYGTTIDCAQCHDHPLAREIKQAHYWGLVAAYNRSKNVRGTTEVEESAVGGYVNFTNLEKESQPAVVTLLTGYTLNESRPANPDEEEDSDDKYLDPEAKVRVPKLSRRGAFADAATRDNPLLARAFVNRMWSVLMGRGIVHPPDEMNARNTPSHPELLDWLAEDFAAHDYDPRRVVRGIVLSRAYGLGLACGDNEASAFAGALERPLTAEQIARSWRVAAGLSPDDEELRWAVVEAIPDVLPMEYNATFQQAQFLASSPLFHKLLEPAEGNTAARLAAVPDLEERVGQAFFHVMGRHPDTEERRRTIEFLREHSGGERAGIRDLLWALMTSAEFLTMP